MDPLRRDRHISESERILDRPRWTAMTVSEISLQFPRGAEPVLLIAPKMRPGFDSGESLEAAADR